MKKRWTVSQAEKLFNLPFFELIFEAQKIHRVHFNPQSVQISTLLSIKTGNCPEDCKYCSQSARYRTDLKAEKLIKFDKVMDSARQAKKAGATRFCMGAAWRNPNDRDIPYLQKIVREVKSLGLETCMTLGTLSENQANSLSEAGLDYYNHNLDTSEEFYEKIITTRKYQERIETIERVQKAGIKVCSGGILGLGETVKDRASLLVQLANLPKVPESVPINMLVQIKGTPLFNEKKIDFFDFVRTIAAARIMLPSSFIRLSAGRKNMNEQMQALCFIAGANSVFSGCKLLTTDNPNEQEDHILFKKLDINLDFTKKNVLEEKDSFFSEKEVESGNFYEAC
ncbi:biotin synthase BioB [Candidatus Riesia pediculicola]|uniref:Biotin synthase n=1 Tax=Riesia pediculicola (strain USDA) TaxID=515618 RepID=D4G8Y7_RIEPU|nr:biotin synthase BioB [Candidatus Riesia pediculicola]ADD79645.1 biotin synthase [Candidatus Riesia pediculicola USDA]ARC53996.1 biotin synthase [Candidatus Riesia pediculicola]QOJ86622.1 biotin synthase BioB [Candidatus Riesia pediculicola]